MGIGECIVWSDHGTRYSFGRTRCPDNGNQQSLGEHGNLGFFYPFTVLPPLLQKAAGSIFPKYFFSSPSQWQLSEELIKCASPNAEAMLRNGHAPHPGEIMRFPELANTFK